MKVSFVSNIDAKIIKNNPINPNYRNVTSNSNAKKIYDKKIANYLSNTNRANTVFKILFINFYFIFQSFVNKSLSRNENNIDKSFSNRTAQYLKTKEKCKYKNINSKRINTNLT